MLPIPADGYQLFRFMLTTSKHLKICDQLVDVGGCQYVVQKYVFTEIMKIVLVYCTKINKRMFNC